MIANLYSEPWLVEKPTDCTFYHSLDLPKSGSQKGNWDLRGDFERYTANVPLAGKTVLDVGTASGFLTFESEKRGASVVSVEALDAKFWDRLPFTTTEHAQNYAKWESNANNFLNRIKKSYWLAHAEYNSKAQVYYGNAYELPAELGRFDVVIVGQILVHLSDVIRVLASITARCQTTLIIAEGMVENPQPVSYLLGRANNTANDFSFWHHSTGFYQEILAILGFKLLSKTTGKYKCNIEGPPAGIDITTMVFQRS